MPTFLWTYPPSSMFWGPFCTPSGEGVPPHRLNRPLPRRFGHRPLPAPKSKPPTNALRFQIPAFRPQRRCEPSSPQPPSRPQSTMLWKTTRPIFAQKRPRIGKRRLFGLRFWTLVLINPIADPRGFDDPRNLEQIRHIPLAERSRHDKAFPKFSSDQTPHFPGSGFNKWQKIRSGNRGDRFPGTFLMKLGSIAG